MKQKRPTISARELEAVVGAFKRNKRSLEATAKELKLSEKELQRRLGLARKKWGVAVVPVAMRSVPESAIPDDELRAFWEVYKSYQFVQTDTAEAVGLTLSAVRHRIDLARKRLGLREAFIGGHADPGKARVLALPRRGRVKRYLFTCAQNNTFLASDFDALLKLKEHYDAELHISTFTYVPSQEGSAKRGTASRFDKREMWYDERIEEYVSDSYLQIAPGLVWAGNSNTSPTAERPLAKTDSFAGRNSVIFPHPKIEMKTVAAMKDEGAKLCMTTGAVTLPHYIQKRAGINAERFHAIGALLVEVDSHGRWWPRHVLADSEGRIYDKTLYADADGVWEGGVHSITWGDIHAENIDPKVREACWGEGGMLDELHPIEQYFHDLHDQQAGSHHNRKDPFERYRLHITGKDSIKREIGVDAEFLAHAHRDWCTAHVVRSNHDEHLERYLKETHWADDLPNAELYADLLKAYLAHIRGETEDGPSFNALEWALREYYGVPDGIVFLDVDKSHVILKDYEGGIECSLHGDLGSNGTYGSPAGFARMGRKINVAHSHSPGIYDFVYYAGHSSKRKQRWNAGPSSWAQAHIVTYENGQRAIYVIWDGLWCAED